MGGAYQHRNPTSPWRQMHQYWAGEQSVRAHKQADSGLRCNARATSITWNSSQLLCSESFYQGQEEHPYSPEDGQQNSSESNGGTHAPVLSRLANQLWRWCLERNLSITAEYLPGVDNCIADEKSRTIQSTTEWQLY